MILPAKIACSFIGAVASAAFIRLVAMSDAAQLACIAAIAPTVTGLGAMLVSIRNGQKTVNNGEKLVQIHTLTNSNLSAVTKALEVANEKITGLERMLREMDKKVAAQVVTPIPVVIEQPRDLPVPVVQQPKSK